MFCEEIVTLFPLTTLCSEKSGGTNIHVYKCTLLGRASARHRRVTSEMMGKINEGSLGDICTNGARRTKNGPMEQFTLERGKEGLVATQNTNSP